MSRLRKDIAADYGTSVEFLPVKDSNANLEIVMALILLHIDNVVLVTHHWSKLGDWLWRQL